MKKLQLDIENIINYGKNAPTFGERIYIKIEDLNNAIFKPKLGRAHTGKVIGGDWDLNPIPLEALGKYQVCHEHFSNGKSWEDSGAYNLMLNVIKRRPGADNCHNLNDIIERYNKLDDIFSNIKITRRVSTMLELNPSNFREVSGIYVHIDRNGNPIFGLGGHHRLSIAKALNIHEIPVQLGVVHENAINIWSDKVRRLSDLHSRKYYINFYKKSLLKSESNI